VGRHRRARLFVTLLASFVIAFGAPEALRSDEKISDWYRGSTNQYRFLVASMIAGLGVIAINVYLFAVWVLLVSIVLLRARSAAGAPSPAGP
jgi:hypothetical protein